MRYIAELAQYDLVRASFVPPLEIRELRDLVRRRVHLQQDRNRVSNRIHRLLELQNIKLSSVLGKMTGATARSILEGLSSKMTMKPEKLALLARHKRVRDRQPELTKALRCHPSDHFRVSAFRTAGRAGSIDGEDAVARTTDCRTHGAIQGSG